MTGVVAAMAAATIAGLLAHRSAPGGAERAGALALTFLFWVVLPFVIVCTLPSLHVDAGLAVALAVAYAALAIAGTIAWIVGTRVLALSRAGVGTLICCTVLANTGYFGLPFTSALLGRDDLPTAIAFDTLVSGPMFFVVALAIGAAFGRTRTAGHRGIGRTLARNPPFFAMLAGLLLPASAVPGWLVDTAHGAIWVLLAAGFFAVGVTLAAEAGRGSLGFPPRLDAPVAAALGLRLAVAPAIYFGLTALTGETVSAFRLEAAMPVGINSLVVAHATGLDLRISASAIAWSTAIVAIWGLAAAAL